MNFINKNKLIIFVLVVTLLKGIIWAYAVPPFQAPDEQIHYAVVQSYAEPANYSPKSFDFPSKKVNFTDIRTQNLSPELKNYLLKTDFDRTRFNEKEEFDFGSWLPFRNQSAAENNQKLSRFVEVYPVWNTNYSPLYYQTGAFIENLFSDWGVAEKSFFVRLASVLFGTIFVLTAYLLFRELNLGKKKAALLAGAVSFQPMLTFISASINVDSLLFASFGMFLWGAMRIIKRNLDWVGLTAAVAGSIISIEAKPSGYFALAALMFLFFVLALKNRSWIWSRIKELDKLVQAVIIISPAVFFLFSFFFT
ncbi:MAG: DUF2142 domain-containing protein [Candidatus Moranbacteria bacterium]|nr:DUF2142 domain-containing protein [Candidatus Moranbacteria bacterium]